MQLFLRPRQRHSAKESCECGFSQEREITEQGGKDIGPELSKFATE
jgi:hypothetical protein